MVEVVFLILFGLFIIWFARYTFRGLLIGELKGSVIDVVKYKDAPFIYLISAAAHIVTMAVLIYGFVEFASAL